MKTLLIAALAVASLHVATPRAEAWRCANTYAPYKVRTCEVHRCAYRKSAHDSCGRNFRYTVTVITYRDFYSDGSTRTYSVTYRS